MIRAEDVLMRAKAISEIQEDEEKALKPFCETAAAFIDGKMRTDASSSDVRLLTAAAAMALCDYFTVKYSEDDAVSSFKAGDVTVSYNADSRMQSYEKLKKSALEQASGLLRDSAFIFECM